MRKEKQSKLLGVGLGAGVLGALFLALKYMVRPATKSRVPDTISPAIFATKVLHTSLGTIVYHESGSGQPLIFVHGVCPGASSYEWSKVYPEFAGPYRVLAPDLIGFGESARPKASIGAADYARTLAEFIRATCNQPPVLVGSGLGAGFCVLLASQHPELVERLILLMPTGLTEFGKSQVSISARMVSRLPLLNRFLYRNYQSTKTAVRSWLTRYGFSKPEAVTDEIVEVFTTCAQQNGAEHSILNLYAGRLSFDLESRIKTLTQPLTLLWSDSAVAPMEWAYRFQGLLKNSNLVILQNVGTLAALEDPAAVAEVLREQLKTELRVL